MVDLEFCWTPDGHWYRTAVSTELYANVMNSGMLHGKVLEAVRLWYSEDDHLVYNFTQAKMGKLPFKAEIAVTEEERKVA